MKLTTNYLILFAVLLYLKFTENKENSKIQFIVIPVIFYIIYQLFKNQNVEGWGDGGQGPSPPCDRIIYAKNADVFGVSPLPVNINVPAEVPTMDSSYCGGGVSLLDNATRQTLTRDDPLIMGGTNWRDWVITDETGSDYKLYCSTETETGTNCEGELAVVAPDATTPPATAGTAGQARLRGWNRGSRWGESTDPDCSENPIYIGSPFPEPGPEDNIRSFIGPLPVVGDRDGFYIGPGCIGLGSEADIIAGGLGGASTMGAVDFSGDLDRENVKTIAIIIGNNDIGGSNNVGKIYCSSSPNDTCVTSAPPPSVVARFHQQPAAPTDADRLREAALHQTTASAGGGASDTHPPETVDPTAPPILHCMDGTDDNTINTDDLLDCFADGGSRCGHENCALYHSLHLEHLITDTVHSSPNDHCSHLLYHGASPNPTMDNGSVIQQIALKYANLNPGLEINSMTGDQLAVEVEQQSNNNRLIFTNSDPKDQKLCAKFNALYDSDCLRGSSNDNHSQLFENIHIACSNISSPPTFDLHNDWLNNMDRYCSIGSLSQTKYNGVPIEQLKHSTYTGYLYATGNTIEIDSPVEVFGGIHPRYPAPPYNNITIGSPQSCGQGYQGVYTLQCDNDINREIYDLQVVNGCSASSDPISVVSSGVPVLGCMTSEATNYNSAATVDDGSCIQSTVQEPSGHQVHSSGTNPCSPSPCPAGQICSPSPGDPNRYICSGGGSGGPLGGGSGGPPGGPPGGGPSVNPCDSSPCQSDQICSPSPVNPSGYICSNTSAHTWKIIGSVVCIGVALVLTSFRKDKQGRVTGEVGEQFASNSITDKNGWSWAASLFAAPFYLLWRICFEFYLFFLKGRQSQFKNPI